MELYTIVIQSSARPELDYRRECLARSKGAAERIAARQLEFLRRYSRTKTAWDTWSVLYQHPRMTTPKLMSTGRVRG